MNKYSEYRNKIKSGDLILLSHEGFASVGDALCELVETATQSPFCHVGIIWKVSGRLFVLESVKPVVRLVPLSNFVKEGFYHIPLKKAMSSGELEFALSKVGNGKYSNWEAIRGFFKSLKIGNNEEWQCAEYVISCRRLSDVNLGDEATPSAVAKAAMALGFQLNYIKN